MGQDRGTQPRTLSDQRVAELIVAHARDYAIFTLDPAGFITSWGMGAERITGYGPDEAIGMDFATLFTASDRAAGQPARELRVAQDFGRAEDSRWHLNKDGGRFWANGVTMHYRDDDGEGLIKVIRDETASRLAEEQRVLLLNELNHRINNTLVTVQSLVEQTLRATDVDRTVRENLTARLVALSDAHKMLVEENWAGADLQTIAERAAMPYEQSGTQRFRLDGPPVRLSPKQAVSMALVLHELTTNAVKYGALSVNAGYVELAWNFHLDGGGGRHMTFLWAEHGGPLVTPPTRQGFGSRLIGRSFSDESDGTATVTFAPDGVRCAISLNLSDDTETPMLDVNGQSPPP